MKLFPLVGAALGCAGIASGQSFDYPDFSSVAGLNPVVSAVQVGNVMRVHEIASMGDNMGGVWYATPVNVAGGFDTTFQFQILGSGSGDGMAFIVQNDTNPGYNGMSGAFAIGRHASACGYGKFVADPATDSIENALVVELDHFQNSNQPGADPILDPDSNHISIHTGGPGETRQQEDHSIGRATSLALGADINNGSVHTVRVVYVPGTLDVYFNGNQVLTVPYDFGTGGTWIDSGTAVPGLNLIGGTSAYVGFTAASGGSSQTHDLISWSFETGSSLGTSFCGPAPNNSSGGPAMIFGTSNPGVGSGLHLEMTGGPAGELGYFLVGTAADPSPSIALGNGFLCLQVGGGNALGRYNVTGGAFNSVGLFDAGGVLQNLVGTSTIGSGFDVPSSVPIPGTPMIMAGETWYFQGWFRDSPAGTGQSNASNGLSVTF